MQIEIDQRDPPRLPVGEVPREVDRHRGRADAAARADEGNHLTEFAADRGRFGAALRHVQRPGDETVGERLDDVIGYPGLQQIAIEPDLIARTDDDDADAGFAYISETVHLGDRQLNIADIDDENTRRAGVRQVLHRLANV